MTAFVPITIYLNHRPMVVASIADAAKALQQPWPFMDKPSRLEAIRISRNAWPDIAVTKLRSPPSRRLQRNRDFISRSPQAKASRNSTGLLKI
jgi:hypothetical protein